MIDLGDELAGFGEEPPRYIGAPLAELPAIDDRGPMRTFGKLADLQKGGFNVNPNTGRGIGTPRQDVSVDPVSGLVPPWRLPPDPLTDDSGWTFIGNLADDLQLNFKTWFDDLDPNATQYTFAPIDQSVSHHYVTVQIGDDANPVVDMLRQDEPLTSIQVPDQPFKWKPNMVTSRSFAFKCRHGIAAGTCRRCSK